MDNYRSPKNVISKSDILIASYNLPEKKKSLQSKFTIYFLKIIICNILRKVLNKTNYGGNSVRITHKKEKVLPKMHVYFVLKCPFI